ncbi:hypothetical protein [Demequina sp.]|uniref:hypothetical protein n=1 Tax=Demequina sp. TaxID=2050685 RepID=UPI0025E6F16D|nr:hypothetical protein [Demequina sp.]
MRWQEILDRFRPVAAPGGAAESAEHVAERTGAALELAPVFAAIDADLAAARQIEADAQARATARVDQAHARASALVARARTEAPAREAAAAAEVLAAASEEDERVISEARTGVDDLLAARTPRVDETSRLVVDRLLDSLRTRS